MCPYKAHSCKVEFPADQIESDYGGPVEPAAEGLDNVVREKCLQGHRDTLGEDAADVAARMSERRRLSQGRRI